MNTGDDAASADERQLRRLRRIVGPPMRMEFPNRTREAARLITRSARILPNFLIVGTQKGGTTSLFHWLKFHRDVTRPTEKEIEFFTRHFALGTAWYRAHFPARVRRLANRPRALVTGEATPYYLMHPLAPSRAASVVPEARLVALLRDPVARAFSLYQHRRRQGLEDLSFAEAVAREPDRLEGEVERMRADGSYSSDPHRNRSYVTGGLYANQLDAWREHFPADQLLVLRSEDLFSDPEPTLSQILDHLRLSESGRPPLDFLAINIGEYDDMDTGVARALAERFAGPNQDLRERYGDHLAWDPADG